MKGRGPGPTEQFVYVFLAGFLGLLGLCMGFLGTRFLSLLLVGYRTRSAYALAFDLICWTVAIVGAAAGLKGAHLLFRRHFPARPRVGDPRTDYEERQGPDRGP